MKDRVCTSCGYVGKPIKQCVESFLVDAFVWGIVGSFALMTGIMPVLVIPAAWTLYHLAKFGTTKCPHCNSLDMVSMDSRKGRAALNHDKEQVRVWTRGDEAPSVK
jgi:hypothetical protein